MTNKNSGKPIYYKASTANFDAPNAVSRVCSAYYANFNSLDSDLDIIRRGAFSKSITDRGPKSQSNRQIKFLHQHNITEPCATFNYLKEDSIGLVGEHVVEKSPLGDVIIERYANGIYKEHSFGFQYIWDKCAWIHIPLAFIPADLQGRCEEYLDPESGQPTGTTMAFECKELNLFETSVVTFGANQNTPFLGFKGSSEDLVKTLQDELEFLIKSAPNYDYELSIRSLWAKQISLAESLAAKGTKEESKPKAVKKNYQSLIKNLKLS